MLRASRHQGDPYYSSNGRQCVANAIHVLKRCYHTCPSKWTKDIFDCVMDDGNDLYQAISNNSLNPSKYWSLEDIPNIIEGTAIHVSSPISGKIGKQKSEGVLFTLNDALINIKESETEGYIFTMGSCTPSYTSAIFLQNNTYYFIDTHSRSETGMVVADGLATITVHKSSEHLYMFIQHLAASAFGQRPNAFFEIARLTISTDEFFHTLTDTDSEFSGFDMSDGEYSCRMYMANEMLDNINTPDVSDVSSINSDSILDSSLLDDAVMKLNDSVCYLEAITVDTINNFIDDDTKQGDDDDGDDDDDDDDDDVPLIYFVHKNYASKNIQEEDNMSSMSFLNGTAVRENDDDDDDDVPLIYLKKQNYVCENKSEKRKISNGDGDDDMSENRSEKRNVANNEVSENRPEERNVANDDVSENRFEKRNVANDDVSENRSEKRNVANDHVSENRSEIRNVANDDVSENRSELRNAANGDDNEVAGNEESILNCSMSPTLENDNVTGNSSRQGRKRVRDVSLWNRNIRKRQRNEGKEYVTVTGKLKSARIMKPGCGVHCRYKCHTNFDMPQRQTLFNIFWALGDINKQRHFISKYCLLRPKSQKKGASERRKYSLEYKFPHENGNTSGIVKVCKTFFLHTLSISERYVHTAQKLSNLGICQDDKWGKHSNRPNRTLHEQEKIVKDHIENFPTVESHYCRKDSQKQYLSGDLSLRKMYFLYKDFCEEKGYKPVSINIYRRVFDFQYNLAFHKPVKDQCDLCMSYLNSNDNQKSEMKAQYEMHLENKGLARKIKQEDKIKSQKDTSFVSACFDLQEVLMTPKSFENSLYYKRRLNTFNFSIYNMAKKSGYCYVWNESISSRGACEIASCVYDFIYLHSSQGKNDFSFFSDNCSGQNKNRYLITMYWFCLNKLGLSSITHHYLEKGHTQNENDSIHATIESASKNVRVYTTPQWATIIRMARRDKPYSVKEMSSKDFYDFKSLSCPLKNFNTNTNGEKIVWNKIKSFRLTSNKPNYFFYKTHHSGEEFQVDLFKRLRSAPNPSEMSLLQLHDDGVPISKEKFADLLTLCKKQIIPPVHHAFFLLLPHETD